MGTDLNKCDPAFRRRVEQALAGGKPVESKLPRVVPRTEPTAGKRVRQSGRGMNKLEAEWLGQLRALLPGVEVRVQAKTYVVANGVRYTPDFTAMVAGTETAWEVKGPFAWEDSLLKLKCAARVWPEVRWVLVWKKGGEWHRQIVLP